MASRMMTPSEIGKLDVSRHAQRIVAVPNQNFTPLLKLKPVEISGIKLSRGPFRNASSSGIQYISGDEIHEMPPRPTVNPVPSGRVVTIEPCTTPYRKKRDNYMSKRTAAGRKLCPEAIVKHRNNEKKRHSQIDMELDRCLALLPYDGSSLSKKDRLQKVVVYVCYLELCIKKLCEGSHFSPEQLHSSDVLSGIPDAAEPCSHIQNLDLTDYKPVALINDHFRLMGLDPIKLPVTRLPTTKPSLTHISTSSPCPRDIISYSYNHDISSSLCTRDITRTPCTRDITSTLYNRDITNSPYTRHITELLKTHDKVTGTQGTDQSDGTSDTIRSFSKHDTMQPSSTHKTIHLLQTHDANRTVNIQEIQLTPFNEQPDGTAELDIEGIIGPDVEHLQSTTEQLYYCTSGGVQWSDMPMPAAESAAEPTDDVMDMDLPSDSLVDDDSADMNWVSSFNNNVFSVCLPCEQSDTAADEYFYIEDIDFSMAADDNDQSVPQM